MAKKRKALAVKVGDIVQIGPAPYVPNLGIFKAEVTQMSENSIGHTILTYKKLRGKTPKFPICNISLVTKILKPAPYILAPRARINIFAERPMWSIEKKGGIYTSLLSELVMLALSKVDHVDLPHPIHIGRSEDLYEKALWPGVVSKNHPSSTFFLDERISVRWKTFERWVNANALRLTMTKAEDREHTLAFKELWDADSKKAIIGDMHRMMEEDLDDEINGVLNGDAMQSLQYEEASFGGE